jgi:uncharacterized membrane-anchored protein YitT (DUF2179 family)
MPPPAAPPTKHSLLDDAQALFAGTLLIALAIALIGKARLMTGGVVGLALLLDYATGVGFGKSFFALNLPFYWLAAKKLGRWFVLKSLVAVSLLSLFSALLPHVLRIEHVDPLFAAILGGLLAGVGLLILFRHRASLGGINVLVLYLQERYGWRAGNVQLGFDAVILLASLAMLPPAAIAVSLLGAAVLNLTLAINHRPGRYMAI